MLYKQDFEKMAARIAAKENYKERRTLCEQMCEQFSENNFRFFVPLFRHAARVEFVPKTDLQDAMIRHRMWVEEEGGDNWFIESLEDHIMINPYVSESWNMPKNLKEKYPKHCRKVNRSMVNGYYWNHGASCQNEFERTRQNGHFLSEDEIENQRFEGQPIEDKSYKDYNPYTAEFDQEDE